MKIFFFEQEGVISDFLMHICKSPKNSRSKSIYWGDLELNFFYWFGEFCFAFFAIILICLVFNFHKNN